MEMDAIIIAEQKRALIAQAVILFKKTNAKKFAGMVLTSENINAMTVTMLMETGVIANVKLSLAMNVFMKAMKQQLFAMTFVEMEQL